MNYRVEKDALGEVRVPEEVYYGAQTERARINFDASAETTNQYMGYIKCVAMIKKAAAMCHYKLGLLSEPVANAIIQASNEIMVDQLKDQFPLNVLQGGGGTSTNMNVNEVIANRANEILTGAKGNDKVHPNNHVNMGQSTNDVIPSAVKLMSWYDLEELRKETVDFKKCLERKAEEFKDVVKLGRTCLQDAMPVTLGQEFSGYAVMIERCIARIEHAQSCCLEVPMGATAIGTGSGTFEGYSDLIAPALAEVTHLPVKLDKNLFDGLQNGDAYADVMHAIKALAVAVSKIATDFRMLSSGPRAGLNEINLPAVQPGSSIMPGKINPVMPEFMNQICYDICGNDLAVTMAVEGGELDLNVWEPLAVKKIHSSTEILTNGLALFRERCVDGITANVETCYRYAENSMAICSIISALFEYRVGSKVSKYAFENNVTIQQAVVEMGILSEEDAKELLDPLTMTDQKKLAALMHKFREKLA